MKRHILPAALLCFALLLHSLPVSASYTSEEIAFAIRPTQDTVSAYTDGAVHVSAADAAAGKTLHFGIYLEAERAEIQILGIRMESDSDCLTLVQESLRTGAEMEKTDPELTYALPDGTQFTTRYVPYCLGKLNSRGNYSPDCFSFNQNADEDGKGLRLYWMSGTEQATAFLGGQSDWYAFYQFDAALAPGTAPGTYHLEFVTAADAETAKSERLTYVTSNDGTVQESKYVSTIPTLKGIEIVVDADSAWQTGDVNHDGNINAIDATAVLIYASKSGTGASFPAEEVQNMLTLGDVNRDGIVNAKDATAILRYAAARGIAQNPTWEDLCS